MAAAGPAHVTERRRVIASTGFAENADPRDVTFLVVDDDQVDRRAFVRAMRRQGLPGKVVVARDGHEALQRLRGSADQGIDPIGCPFVVLLDLNMPRMGGLEFLEELRADPRLRRAVVFVFSTSDDPLDKAAAYDRNVAGYLVKTGDSTDYDAAVRLLGQYVEVVRLPGERRH